MRKARQTTPEERLEIVLECLANDRNYAEGGRRVGTQPARTHEEEFRDKIAELERKNYSLQMENDLLKKSES